MCVSKTIDHIQIKIKMPTPNQKPSAAFKAINQDLQDIDVFCNYTIKIES